MQKSPQDSNPHIALPELDFSGFVLSLASSAMHHLREIPGEAEEAGPLDLPAARQIIDILQILVEKTRGNLSEAESKMLSSLLYDLRVQYVDAKNKHGE